MELSPYRILCIYLIIINFSSGIIFAYDKNAAKRKRRRIPERVLHLLELMGGIFINLVLMYLLHHKNRKFSYWSWTWLILIGWGICIYIFKKSPIV